MTSATSARRSGGNCAGECRRGVPRHPRAPSPPSVGVERRAARRGTPRRARRGTSRRRCSTRPVSVMSTRHEPASGRAARARRGARATLPSDGYCTSATWLVSCESRRTVRASTSSRSTDWPRKVSIAWRCAGAQRPQVGELVDEDPVALVGRHAAGRGVRGRDELLLFELRHVVADGRGRDAERVPLDDRLRADRLARGDVVLHDDAQHVEAALGDHGPPAFRR